MILTNEDYDGLVQIQKIISRIISHAVQSEIEEAHEREFNRLVSFHLQTSEDSENSEKKEIDSSYLKFTEAEILKMPKQFRKIFRVHGCKAHVRKRELGRYKCSYEIRYAKKPYNKRPISASGTSLEEAKARFIEKLNNYVLPDDTTPNVPNNFDGFALYWFENFHKAKVIANTYKINLSLYNRHIKPNFQNYALRDITPSMLKSFIDGLPGNGKTADDVHSILKQIFDTAVTHGKVKINPINLFVHLQHERESGIELTRSEEIALLNFYKGSDYEIIFSVMLYTGLRIGEYKTARIEGDFLVAINSKRKKGKIEYKKIPICSHLRRRLEGLTELPRRHEVGIRKSFNKVFPDHTPKDLRKTFNTRCIECKVDFFARKKYMGHSVGKLDKTYTGSLEAFLLEEGAKLNSWYSQYPNNTPKN